MEHLLRELLQNVIAGWIMYLLMQGGKRVYRVKTLNNLVEVWAYDARKLARERDDKSDISSRGFTASRDNTGEADWVVTPTPIRK